MQDEENTINNEEEIIDEEFETLDEEGDELKSKDKIKALKEKIKLLEKEKQDNLNGWLRSQADYKNREMQINKERFEWAKNGVKRFAEELLVVMDTYDAAKSNKSAWESVDANWRVGIEYIFSTFENKLKDNGFVKFGECGEKFDPKLHEGLGTVDTDDESKVDTIAQIITSGYKYNGELFRPAKVKVYSFKA